MVLCPTPGGEPAGDGGADCALSAGHGRTGGRVSGPWTYAPGAVFADLAAAVAGEADCERLPPHRSFRLYLIPLYATTRLQVVSGPRYLC